MEILQIGNKLKTMYHRVLFLARYSSSYINDLPRILDENTITVLFADDTSILITGSDKTDLDENINQAFQKINNWFNSNRLTLNLNKTQFLEFRINHFLLIVSKRIMSKSL